MTRLTSANPTKTDDPRAAPRSSEPSSDPVGDPAADGSTPGRAGPMPRAVMFDFGDTLVHFGNVDRRAIFEQAAWRTYRMWAARQRRMPGYRRYYLHQWFALRWAFFKTLVLRRELDAMRLIRRACRKLWLNAPQSFFEELAWNWYRPLAEHSRVDADAHRVLRALNESGWQLALVSNTFVPGFVIDRHLRQLGLLRYFPVRIYSCDVGYRKPHPRIFETALHQLNVTAEDAVFVGDSFSADITGAARCGIEAIWRLNGEDDPVRPDVRFIHDLNELPALLGEARQATPGAVAGG